VRRRSPRTTVPEAKPPRLPARPAAPRGAVHPPAPRTSRSAKPHTRRQVAHLVTDSETSLLDVIDNLLSKGVVLNADLILALANVDLIYVRLSALLVAADRLLPDSDDR
jgi:gas vesicle structural protein